MADLQEVEELVQEVGINAPVERVGRAFILRTRREMLRLPETEVDEFLARRDTLRNEPETAVSTDSYFEQAVDMPGPRPARMLLFRRDQDTISLESHTSGSTIEISPISTLFLLELLASGRMRTLHRAYGPIIGRPAYRSQGDDSPRHLRELYSRILTIKVSLEDGYARRTGRGRFQQLAEAGLFHISFGRGVALGLLPSWERERQRIKRRREQDLQFPRRLYDRELLSYYYLALSSESHILTYLSFYQILEFFFTGSSDRVLHGHLATALSQPEFSPQKPEQLRRLTGIVRRLDQKTDERRMLVNVIEQYFSPDELADWVRGHEQHNQGSFTDIRDVFGKEVALDLSEAGIAGSVATRIYHIRNVLVHNKEGELPRFIPFSEHDEMLAREIPLVQFLAEQLIIRTGTDMG